MSGAGCLLWIEYNGQILVLTGKESKYLRDIHTEVSYKDDTNLQSKSEIVSVESLERLKQSSGDFVSVKILYGKIAKRIEDELGQKVQFDTPELMGDNYHCNFRILMEGAKRGICKGGRKPSDKTSKDTAQRELMEETGMIFNRTNMELLGVFLGYEMFQFNMGKILDTPQESYDEVLTRIHKRETKKYGELFDIGLRPLDEIIEWVCNNEYNAISRETIYAFVMSKGTEAQKTRIRTGLGRRGGNKLKKTRGKRPKAKRSKTRSKK
jgi:8-oxo-dGTP pyrophosphatase MutT (NUDIX family)